MIRVDSKKLHDLSEFAVTTRYPGDEPTLSEARTALEVAKDIRKMCRNLLGIA